MQNKQPVWSKFTCCTLFQLIFFWYIPIVKWLMSRMAFSSAYCILMLYYNKITKHAIAWLTCLIGLNLNFQMNVWEKSAFKYRHSPGNWSPLYITHIQVESNPFALKRRGKQFLSQVQEQTCKAGKWSSNSMWNQPSIKEMKMSKMSGTRI